MILFINDVFAKVLKTDQFIDGLGFDLGIYNLVLGGVVALAVFRYLPRFLVGGGGFPCTRAEVRS